jgi:plasmid stabilization system protein ParE
MDINWTPKAKTDFNKILEYLHENWGIKEVRNFIKQTESVLKDITSHP